mgnify:CR=1 FL=1
MKWQEELNLRFATEQLDSEPDAPDKNPGEDQPAAGILNSGQTLVDAIAGFSHGQGVYGRSANGTQGKLRSHQGLLTTQIIVAVLIAVVL